MKSVTKPKGTGRKAAIPGLSIAAKTGTSKKFDPSIGEYSSKLYTSSFVGFFPADDPKLTLFVMVDEPTENYLGSKSAAIIFKEIAKKVIHFYPLQKTDTEATAVAATANPPFGAPQVTLDAEEIKKKQEKEESTPFSQLLKGKTLREALRLATKYQKTISFQGSGKIKSIKQDRQKENLYHITLKPL